MVPEQAPHPAAVRGLVAIVPGGVRGWCRPSMTFVIQGVKTKATESEISMPIEALIGIGLM